MSDPIGIEETLAYLRARYGPVPNTSGLETQIVDYTDETDLRALMPDENTPECQLKQCCSIPGEAQNLSDETDSRVRSSSSDETELTSIGGLLRGERHLNSGVTAGETASNDDWKERHYDARLEAEMEQEAQGMDDQQEWNEE